MASIFGHAMVGFTVSKIATRNVSKQLIILAIISSILPDADVLAFNFGIPYTAPLGHRGFTHSIIFAILWTSAIVFLFGKKNKLLYALVIFLSTISHGILDAMTTGGKGVGFFIPFDNERYFFPWQVIKVSPIGVERFFSEWGIKVILSELKYIIIPCLIIISLKFIATKTIKQE